MKFTAKYVGLLNGLQPVIAVSETGAKREYPDAYKVSLTSKSTGLIAEANNGNVAACNKITSQSQSNLDYLFGVEGSVTISSKDLTNTLLSFDKEELLDIELKGNELTFTPQSDAEKFQTIAVEVRQIEMPPVAKSFSKEVTINKGVLISAMSKVLFAIGTEKYQPQFFYWVMRFKPDWFRAVCGDGGLFAIYEIEGNNVGNIKQPLDVLIFKEHNATLQKALSLSDSPTVTFREYSRGNSTDNVPDQIVVELDTLSLVLIGHDPGVKWPDENKILVRSSSYKFVSRLSDWEKEAAGVFATFNEEARNAHEVHFTQLTLDAKKSLITLNAEKTMRARRKVKVIDSWVAGGVDDEPIDFKATTTVLREVLRQGDGNIQIELRDGQKPMLIRHFAGDKVSDAPLHRVNQTAGNKEQYTLFFGALSKKKDN